MQYTTLSQQEAVDATTELIHEMEREHLRLVLIDHAHDKPQNQQRIKDLETMVARLLGTLVPDEPLEAPVGEGGLPPDPGAASLTGSPDNGGPEEDWSPDEAGTDSI